MLHIATTRLRDQILPGLVAFLTGLVPLDRYRPDLLLAWSRSTVTAFAHTPSRFSTASSTAFRTCFWARSTRSAESLSAAYEICDLDLDMLDVQLPRGFGRD